MFYCEPCREKNGWPETRLASLVECGACGKTTDCYNHPATAMRPVRVQEHETPVTPADPDRACPHDDFEVHANVNVFRETDDATPHAYMCDLRVKCAQCGEPMRWMGVAAGLSWQTPMVSVDEFELRAPIRPASSDPDFGMGIPGFAITRVVRGEAGPADGQTPE